MTLEEPFMSKAQASKYLGCSTLELIRWVRPDRVFPDNHPTTPSMRLWSRATLDAAKPRIAEYREFERNKQQFASAEAEAIRRAREAKWRRKVLALPIGKPQEWAVSLLLTVEDAAGACAEGLPENHLEIPEIRDALELWRVEPEFSYLVDAMTEDELDREIAIRVMMHVRDIVEDDAVLARAIERIEEEEQNEE
jgi:hypothetical protein